MARFLVTLALLVAIGAVVVAAQTAKVEQQKKKDIHIQVSQIAHSAPGSDSLQRVESTFDGLHSNVMTRLNKVLRRVSTFGQNGYKKEDDKPARLHTAVDESQVLLMELEGRQTAPELLSLNDLSADSMALLESSASESSEAAALLGAHAAITQSGDESLDAALVELSGVDHPVVLSANSLPNPLEAELLKEQHSKVDYLLNAPNQDLSINQEVLDSAANEVKQAGFASERFQDFTEKHANQKLVPDNVLLEADADSDSETEAEAEVVASTEVETEADADADAEATVDTEAEVETETEAATDAASETESESATESTADAGADADAETDAASEMQANASFEFEAEADLGADMDATVENAVVSSAEAGSLSDMMSAAQLEQLSEFEHSIATEVDDSADAELEETDEYGMSMMETGAQTSVESEMHAELSNTEGARGNYPGWSPASLLEISEAQAAAPAKPAAAAPSKAAAAKKDDSPKTYRKGDRIIPVASKDVVHIDMPLGRKHKRSPQGVLGIRKIHVHVYGKGDADVDRTQRLQAMVRRLAGQQKIAYAKINELIAELRRCGRRDAPKTCLPAITNHIQDWKADNFGEI